MNTGRKSILKLLSIITCFMLLLSSCGSRQDETETQPQTNNQENNAAEISETSDMAVSALSGITDEDGYSFTEREFDSSYNESNSVSVFLSDGGCTVSGSGAAADENSVVITEAGTYILSGKLSDGSVRISAGKDIKIQLVLNGVSVHNESGPAIYIQSADKVFITLAENSENTLSDGTSYNTADDGTTLDAALFSKEDLAVNGSGILNISGGYKHGIVSKDDLVITGGTINVTAEKVGLNGKDCVKIGGGIIDIKAGSDGIRSDNSEDSSRGYIYIADGNISITAENDGIQAETVLKISGGTIKISSGGGSSNASVTSSGEWNSGWKFAGGSLSGSTSNISEESGKGLKSADTIKIVGGTMQIDSADDSLHSNNAVYISGGTIKAESGDDGIHADTSLIISDGSIEISKSYEGIESAEIEISGGTISIVSSDDGINAAGGADSSSVGGRPGQGMFSSDSGQITISGGYIFVNAAGDGIDSNGTLLVNGGITLVSGPTDSANGALDYEVSADVSGGVLIALGSSGMAQGFTSASSQGAILYNFASQSAGTPFAVVNEEGSVVASFTPPKAYQSATVTAPGIVCGGTYTLISGGTVNNADANGYTSDSTISGGNTLAEITMSENIYSSNGAGIGMGNEPGMGMNGDPSMGIGGNKPDRGMGSDPWK